MSGPCSRPPSRRGPPSHRGGDRLGLGDDRDPGRPPAPGGRGAAHLGGGRRQADSQTGGSIKPRIALAALALVSLVVIAMPMLAVREVRQSQADARAGDWTVPWMPLGAPSASRGSPPPQPAARPGARGPGRPGGGRGGGAGGHPRGIDQLAHLAHPVSDRVRARTAGGRRRRLSHRAPSTPARPCSQAGAARDHNETLPDARSRERRDPRAGAAAARAAAGDGEAARAGAAAAAAGVQGRARQALRARSTGPSGCDC